jgi:hypothetical protein
VRWLVFAALAAALPALAATPQWPPSEAVQARMHELQQVIIARDSTPAQRDAARAELAGLLKSPAGRANGPTPDEKPVHPPRAAIDPHGPILMPAIPAVPRPPVASSDVARLEVREPPRPILIPVPGAVRMAIDPRTGDLMRETPGGFLDPKTGQIYR